MKNVFKGWMIAMMLWALLWAPAVSASEGVEVRHVGVNNALVRVTGGGRYLLLPVQESSDDAKINILVDGNKVETIYVRLAKSKTDYLVPFDLKPYEGHSVILDIVLLQGRSSIREAKEDVCWRDLKVSETFDLSNRERYRPAFHHTPLYGWMNDPNGMFYKDGRWHLYYQYNPYGSKWQNMTWGHSVSTDLVTWEHCPNAIRPNGLGAVFSGSCALDTANTAGYGRDAVIALYTSAGTSQMQSLAASLDDGLTFDNYTGNPVITLESEARDPKIFWNGEIGQWNLVLAHAPDREILIFTSPDLKHWEYQSSFGKGQGAQGGVWECPDLFELPVAGTDRTKWVLLCNINPDGPFGGSGTQYFVGDFDGRTFRADTDETGAVTTKWLDYGKDHYATVTWSNAPNGRRTAIGWMSNWQYAAEVPTRQFRSANTLPREIGLFLASDGEIYASCTPSPELDSLRERLVGKQSRVVLGKRSRTVQLPTLHDGICEIVVDIDAGKAAAVEMALSNREGDRVVMQYDPKMHSLSFDRTRSGIVDFSENFPAVTAAPTYEETGKLSLRIFIDRSSIEVFSADGRFVMTNLVFPRAPYTTLTFTSREGNSKIGNLCIYSLKENQHYNN